MAEEETNETQEAEAPKEEGSEEAPKEEAAAEEVVAPAESEEKAKASLEVKSRFEAIDKRIEAIEKSITKPVMKSISEQAPPRNAQEEAKAIEPLDLI